MDLIRYVGSFHFGNQALLKNAEEGNAFFSEIFYWYKSKLSNYLLIVPFKDMDFDDLYGRFKNLFLREKEKLIEKSYPVTFESMDAHFKLNVYDPLMNQVIDQIAEVDQERTFFMNYVKKRRWSVTDQFWVHLQEYGEIHIAEIRSDYAVKLIPVSFVEKCHLKIIR
ncbi:hypothetical protein P7D98_18690 [Enterococcus avium]|uniref:hypothetical protein n=1 Tax=Enterococcus avium TaxID=33945 RepID=UPI00288FB25D|nr:hypothetical protein [Enterococcus avium]MDT2467695.1 hypothetical protein [Enterococcus avium]MDT2507100.1 hypothetical protein [Enterococcus avium]